MEAVLVSAFVTGLTIVCGVAAGYFALVDALKNAVRYFGAGEDQGKARALGALYQDAIGAVVFGGGAALVTAVRGTFGV